MEHGDIQQIVQALLYLKAAGGGDVLQIDASEDRCQLDAGIHDLISVLGIEAQGEGVHVCEALEQCTLPFHDRQRGHRADIAQPQHSTAVGHHGHGIGLDGVVIGSIRVFGYLNARLGYTGRIGYGQIVARIQFHLGDDFQLPVPRFVRLERFFLYGHGLPHLKGSFAVSHSIPCSNISG